MEPVRTWSSMTRRQIVRHRDLDGEGAVSYPLADVDLDETLVRSLLREQYGDVDSLKLELVGEGFVIRSWRLGDDLALRLPRRRVAEELLLNELRWLPQLASSLPVPISVATFTGRPNENYPYVWAMMGWSAGRGADVPEVATNGSVAQDTANFLVQSSSPCTGRGTL
jgi:aminoglycoside phosphotransferase (APT) family kinase protein